MGLRLVGSWRVEEGRWTVVLPGLVASRLVVLDRDCEFADLALHPSPLQLRVFGQ